MNICLRCQGSFKVTPIHKERGFYTHLCISCNKTIVALELREASKLAAPRGPWRKFIARYKKDMGCAICNFKEYVGVLHLHHLNPKGKHFELNYNTVGYTWDELLREVLECEVLCANHHFMLHHKVCSIPRNRYSRMVKAVRRSLKGIEIRGLNSILQEKLRLPDVVTSKSLPEQFYSWQMST